jgi:hypothetical protein
MSPVRADLSALLEIEQEAMAALNGLAGVGAAPEARACLDELHFAMRWFCSGLARHVRRPVKRAPPRFEPGVAAPIGDRLIAAPTGVDRIRLLTHTQRSVLVRVETVLAGSLAPELRAFLEQARAVLAQNVHCCEDAIASLDREREVRLDSGL